MHKCQGMAQLLSLPGPAPSTFELVESAIPAQLGAAPSGRDEQSLFDGIDYTIGGLARFAGPNVPRELTAGLAAMTAAVQNAQKAFQTVSDAATVPPLIGGLRAVRQLRTAAARDADRRGGTLRDRLPTAPEGTRVPAGDCRRQQRAHRRPGRRRRGRAGPAREGVADRRQSRRRRRQRQAGQVRRLLERRHLLAHRRDRSDRRPSRARRDRRRRDRPCRCSRKIRSRAASRR